MKKIILRFFPGLRNILFIFFTLAFVSKSVAQNTTTFTLEDCITLAAEHYPLVKQKGYLQAIGANNLKGINDAWLPQISFDFKATYQSEVPSFDFEGFPALVFPKDQYSFGVQVSQTILDGGLVNQQKITEQANTDTEIQKNEVELYKVKDKILQLYGTILLTKENIEVLQSYIDDIKNRQLKMTSSVENGTMLESDLDVLDAEMLKTEQKMIEANSNLKVLYNILALLIDRPVDGNSIFTDLPVSQQVLSDEPRRPELKLFSMQENLLGEKIKLSIRKTQPRLSAFGDGAFGRPGYNFLNQKMRFYGIVGLGLTWNLSSLFNLSYDKSNLEIQRNVIQEQRDLFQLNLNSMLIKDNGEIQKYREMTALDSSIVNKRKAISATKANQLDNGIITSSDYLTELNEEKQAVLTQHMHGIQLGMAIANLKITSGN